MVVNLDTGFGVSTTVSVPDGEDLRFERDGRVTLSGASVARLSYTFQGAVFAGTAYAPTGLRVRRRGRRPDRTRRRAARWHERLRGDPPARRTRSIPRRRSRHGDPILLTAHDRARRVALGLLRAGGPLRRTTGTGDAVDAAPRPFAGVFDHSVFDPDPTGSAVRRGRLRVGGARAVRA